MQTISTDDATNVIFRDEFCATYGIAKATAEFWAHKGKGPKCFRIGKRAAYHRADIDAWLEGLRKRADVRFGKKAA